jgi:hypothetical protein
MNILKSFEKRRGKLGRDRTPCSVPSIWTSIIVGCCGMQFFQCWWSEWLSVSACMGLFAILLTVLLDSSCVLGQAILNEMIAVGASVSCQNPRLKLGLHDHGKLGPFDWAALMVRLNHFIFICLCVKEFLLAFVDIVFSQESFEVFGQPGCCFWALTCSSLASCMRILIFDQHKVLP